MAPVFWNAGYETGQRNCPMATRGPRRRSVSISGCTRVAHSPVWLQTYTPHAGVRRSLTWGADNPMGFREGRSTIEYNRASVSGPVIAPQNAHLIELKIQDLEQLFNT